MGLLRIVLLGSVVLAACGEATPRIVNAAGAGGESTGGAPVFSTTGGAPSTTATATGGVIQAAGGTTTGGASVIDGGAGTSSGGGSPGAGSGGNAGTPGKSSSIPVTPVVPNVLLVVDRSLSMLAEFGSQTRWDALHAALFDPALGAVPKFETTVHFGLALFTGPQIIAPMRPSAECPILVEVPTGATKSDQLVAAYEASDPFGTTPTGPSLDLLWPKLEALDKTVFPGPNVIVLATDGEPNTCDDNQDMATGRTRSESAITKAYAAGIRTFVLSVGDDVSAEHLRRIANLGQGLPAEDSTERFLRVGEPTELTAALDRIFGELIAPLPSP
jgi:hypothetical protein